MAEKTYCCIGKTEFGVGVCTSCSSRRGSSLTRSSPGVSTADVSRSKRSRFEILPDADIEAMTKGYTPPKTEATTKWALNNFSLWMQNRSALSEDAVPEDILTCSDPATLCHWLCRFSAETKPKAGGHYPPSTIYALIAGLQKHMKSINPNSPTILYKKDTQFRNLHNSYTIAWMFYSGECWKATREQLWYTTNP